MDFKIFDENPIEDFNFCTNVYTLDIVIGDLRKILKHQSPNQ